MDITNNTVTVDSDGAAKILQICRQTVEERARDGIIPGCKPGKKWVFVVTDLVQWLRDEASKQQAARKKSNSASMPKTTTSRRNYKPALS